MNIGIDIDDTIVNTYEILETLINKYNKNNSNKLLQDLKNRIVNNEISDELNEFYKNYYTKMNSEVKVKENVVEVLKLLKINGHKLIFITARTNRYVDDINEYIKDFFKANNILFDNIITNATDKLNECIDNNIDIMIDDSITVCNKLNQNNINTLLMTSIINKDIETRLTRVSNWNEVLNYINKIKN